MFDAMRGLLVALLIVAFPAITLIAARFWRTGRFSDRAMTNLVIGLVPALILAYGVVQGSSLPFALAMAALVLAPGLVLYRIIFDLVREQRSVVK
jgi:tellurite resistance protein TehA-like permease